MAGRYDVLFCDVWGVVHDGVAKISSAVDALVRYRRGGGTVILLTNAPRPRASLMAMLDRLGVTRDAYDALVSSGDVTVDIMVARAGAPAHHLGPARDDALFETAATRGAPVPRVGVEDADYVVCSGLMNDADRPEIYDPLLERMRSRNLPFICANPDIVVHTGDALVFCAGALAERYAAIGGEVLLIGKPHSRIYEAVRAEAERLRKAPVPNDRILAVGDGIFTDVVGADRQGIAAVLITSGIHRDRIRMSEPNGAFRVEPAAYASLVREAGVVPFAHMDALAW